MKAGAGAKDLNLFRSGSGSQLDIAEVIVFLILLFFFY